MDRNLRVWHFIGTFKLFTPRLRQRHSISEFLGGMAEEPTSSLRISIVFYCLLLFVLSLFFLRARLLIR